MLTEEDEKEERLWHRHRCPNCFYFNTVSGYCIGCSIKYYKPHEPDRYKRCKYYKDKYKIREKANKHLEIIKENLSKKSDNN